MHCSKQRDRCDVIRSTRRRDRIGECDGDADRFGGLEVDDEPLRPVGGVKNSPLCEVLHIPAAEALGIVQFAKLGSGRSSVEL